MMSAPYEIKSGGPSHPRVHFQKPQILGKGIDSYFCCPLSLSQQLPVSKPQIPQKMSKQISFSQIYSPD